jgi:membrane protease subunit HflC
MKNIFIILGVIAVVALSVIGGMFFIVDETQQVIVTQFGKPVGEPIATPGLYMKTPFIQDANYFDKRFLAWDGEPNQIPTKDKRFIVLDTYARWRIADPLLFFQRLRDERGARSRLDDILDGEARNTIAKHKLIELVRSANPQEADEPEPGGSKEGVLLEPIKYGREKLAREVLKAASARTADLGIEILDFRFKRINYVEDVRKEVYARMISERKRIAEQYRSEGAGEAARIEGEKQRELKAITSEAYRTAQEIKGRADGAAADIYASAYGKDPEFYRFLRTMESYGKTLSGETTAVMSTDGDFLRYLNQAK